MYKKVISLVAISVILSYALTVSSTKLDSGLSSFLGKPFKVSELKHIGPDGGDMHLVFMTSEGTLIASHSFGGIWRSEDLGASWKEVRVKYPDLNLNCIAETSDGKTLIAGTNRYGIVLSRDDGSSWEKVETLPQVDEGLCEVISVAAVNEREFFFTINCRGKGRGTSLSQNGVYEFSDGQVKFHKLSYQGDLHFRHLAQGRDVLYIALKGDKLLVSSAMSGVFSFDLKSRTFRKLLDGHTTRISIGSDGKVFVGTLGQEFFIGEPSENQESYTWRTVSLKEFSPRLVSYVIPDPYDSRKVFISLNCDRGGLYSRFTGRAKRDFSREFDESRRPLRRPSVRPFRKHHKKGLGRRPERRYPEQVETPASGSANLLIGLVEGDKFKLLNRKGNFTASLAIVRPEADIPNSTIDTEYGRFARYVWIAQGGAGCINMSSDGGMTWRRAYDGIYGDTINEISFSESGILRNALVVTCVSGTQISLDYGESWIPGIDFSIGDVGYGMSGYIWKAVSPPYKLDGRYDLILATGYPPERGFTGNGVYAVDTTCIKEKGKDKGALKRDRAKCVERLVSGPVYDLLIIGDELYIGRMDKGAQILNLKTGEVQWLNGLSEEEAGMNLAYDGQYVYVSTYIGEKHGDHYFFSQGARGRLLRCEALNCQQLLSGYRVIGMEFGEYHLKSGHTVKGVLLTSEPAIYIMEDSGSLNKYKLPKLNFSDIAVDWENGRAYLSTFTPLGNTVKPELAGIYMLELERLSNTSSVKLNPLVAPDGLPLPTTAFRNLLFINGYLLAGTEGMSVFRIKP